MSLDYSFTQHPLYGRIRLLRHAAKGRDGKTREWWEYDPEFEPHVPAGAVKGDPSQQVYCRGHHVPKYFYVDEERRCVECDQPFLFGAAEQRFWYESLKFNFNSVALRCPRCRKRRRGVAALNTQVARARAAAAANATAPTPHLELAEALIRLHERTGQGRLSDAIAAARKAAGLWDGSPEPLFWEGLAHLADGRTDRGLAKLREFLSHPDGRRLRRGALAREAREILKAQGGAI